MSKKVNKLTEPNMRLYFLLAAVFCAVTLWIEPILGLVEAVKTVQPFDDIRYNCYV